MIEIVAIFAVVVFVVACVFWPVGGSASLFAKGGKQAGQTALKFKEDLSEDSSFENQFLAQLQREIEVTLFPRPTDSVLKRHYDSLIAAKLGERLAQMPV
ncbi:MAG: hypothetical protein ABSB19_13975 [Methylomonas sp.]|jgi:hypothetical protein